MQLVPYQPFRDLWVYREIASGGMSVVYLAVDPTRALFVALKTLLEELWEDADHRARFEREVAVQRSLHHPHIVRFLSAEASPEGCFLATEYLQGRSLDQVLAGAPGGLPVPEVVRILEGLTAALFHAHSKEVVHRDIQPRNVIVEDTGGVKLFDFGIALASDDLVQTKTGTVMGTFAYSSPEQNQGRKVDERSDLYSLGLVVHELLTGQRAIQGATLLEITEFQLRREIPPPGVFRLDIPDGLSQLIHRLTQRWPEDRPRSARHVLDELIQLKATATRDERAQLESDQVQAQLDVARRVLHGGRPEQALARAQRAEALRPGDGPANLLLGRIHTRLGDLEAAEAAYGLAREDMPDQPDVVVDQALSMFALRRPERSRRLCEGVLDRFPRSHTASCLLAYLNHREGLPLPPPPPPEPVTVVELPELSLPVRGGPAPPPPPPEPILAPSLTGADYLDASSPGLVDPSVSGAHLELRDFQHLPPPVSAPPPRPAPAPSGGSVVPGSRHAAGAGEPRAAGTPPSTAGAPAPATTAPRADETVARVRAWQKRMRQRSELLVALAAGLFPGLGLLWLGRGGRGLARLLEGLALTALFVALVSHPALRGLHPSVLVPAGLQQLSPGLPRGDADPRLVVGWLLALAVVGSRLLEIWGQSRAEALRLREAALSPPVVECAYGRGGFVFLVTHGLPDRPGEDYLVLSGGADPRALGRYLGDARCMEGGEARCIYRFAPALGDESDLAGAVLLPRYMLEPSRLL